MKTDKSGAFLDRLSRLVPGGANSNARCGSGLAIARAEGARLIDLDGNQYIDYVLGFGPIILGHADSVVHEAVCGALRRGTTYAFSHELELELAERIVTLCPSVEAVRLCNSGSDAADTAYRLACAHTGAVGVIKMEGDYHGCVWPLLHDVPGFDVSGPVRKPRPACRGIPEAVSHLVHTVPFNDVEALAQVLDEHRREIAAVFMEPILGNTAAIMPLPGYLADVRELCDRHGVVLVFDEVKTGFRVALGGAQALFGVHSDLTMLGKAIANGFPLAALGGRRELMELIGPGGVHHCGTHFGNVPCTAAANATLTRLQASDYTSIERRGRKLAQGICDILADMGVQGSWHGTGAMFGITIGSKPPNDYRSWWMETDRLAWMEVGAKLRNLGILVDGFIGLFFLSFSHTDEDVLHTLVACREAVQCQWNAE
jgi:glutamate-1-semialdehyde 2,1-aminomutase